MPVSLEMAGSRIETAEVFALTTSAETHVAMRVPVPPRPATSGHRRQIAGGVVEPPPAVLGPRDDVLEAYAEPVRQVHAGLDGEAHSRHQFTRLALHHVR